MIKNKKLMHSAFLVIFLCFFIIFGLFCKITNEILGSGPNNVIWTEQVSLWTFDIKNTISSFTSFWTYGFATASVLLIVFYIWKVDQKLWAKLTYSIWSIIDIIYGIVILAIFNKAEYNTCAVVFMSLGMIFLAITVVFNWIKVKE
ncbi:hypothetical protein [Mycoplasma hafezii]|uniref:hypothetical protein n=1 Tax=Mycoplasma hafezii TaxID=525886 RepID=UPI003CE9D617